MGKKKKILLQEESREDQGHIEQVEIDSSALDTDSHSTKKKKKSKKDKVVRSLNDGEISKDGEDIELSNVNIDEITNKRKKSKSNKVLTNPHEQASKEEEVTTKVESVTTTKKLKKKLSDPPDSTLEKANKRNRKKNNPETTDTYVKTLQNTKMVFTNAEPHSAPSESNVTKKKPHLNEDEAEVRDEDIDKYCDEVGDEDNELYENWVKLVEAKLHSNTKKEGK